MDTKQFKWDESSWHYSLDVKSGAVRTFQVNSFALGFKLLIQVVSGVAAAVADVAVAVAVYGGWVGWGGPVSGVPHHSRALPPLVPGSVL